MMMAQVSGRAGRKGKQGRVILQTKSPEHPVIRHVVDNDYEEMYREVMEERETFCYPPFCHIVYVYVKHRNEGIAESAAILLGGYLRQSFAHRVLGPDRPAVARIKTLSIRKLVVKLDRAISLRQAKAALRRAQALVMADKRYASLQIYFDVDPL